MLTRLSFAMIVRLLRFARIDRPVIFYHIGKILRFAQDDKKEHGMTKSIQGFLSLK
jgi:hypothetical protein